jgi:hypothetical protein
VFGEISSHVVGKGDEEIFPNWGWVWGCIPRIGKFPIALLMNEERKNKENKRRKKGKEKEMFGPTHYPA